MFTMTTSSSRRGLRDLLLSVVGISLLALLSGCGAVHTSIAKANLDVSSKMSDAVFLDPVGKAQRTIFVQVRNTSDKPNFNIEQPIKAAIAAKGYRIVDDPEQATFKLQAQILSVAKTDPDLGGSRPKRGLRWRHWWRRPGRDDWRSRGRCPRPWDRRRRRWPGRRPG